MSVVSEYERGKGTGFERIRRITGYISGSLSTWGSSKRAEERDRVKHVDEETTSTIEIAMCALPKTVNA